MDKITIELSEEEIKKIKKDFNKGQVYTDGCFCGHAISNFRDDLYMLVYFSCRKSMSCESDYYQVNGIDITKKAEKIYTEEEMQEIMKKLYEEEEIKLDGKDVVLVNDYYSDTEIKDIHIVVDELSFGEDSIKYVQKKLFKVYKKTYGRNSEAKFKDVGYFNY